MLSAEEISRVTSPLSQAWTLPPGAYTDPGIFAREAANIFYREWICVARQEQLPEPGDYRLVTVLRQPLIIVRGDDNQVRAMSAICPHRGMPVVSDHGHATHFSCPYHLWKFDLAGKLVSAPLMDEVDELPPDCGLSGVQVDTWQGFIFVNLDPEAAPLSERLAGLDELVGAYNMGDMRIACSHTYDSPWNWKLLVENFMEAYHHIGPHNGSLQATYPAKQSYVSGSPGEGWSVLHMPSVKEEAAALPAIEGLNETQSHQSLASVIMPTFCWINTPAVAFWYELKPRSHDQLDLTIHALAPPAVLAGEEGTEVAGFMLEVIKAIHEEDIPVNLGPWSGMNAPLTGQGRLSRLEESIWQLNQWWAERVCTGE